MNDTLKLIRQIGTPFEPDRVYAEPEECKAIYKYAFKNRIALLYLLGLKKSGRLDGLVGKYEELDFRSKETMVTAARAARVLNDIDVSYVIFKTIRPYPATPNDVDILCLDDSNNYRKAVKAFFDSGYVNLAGIAPMQISFADTRGGQLLNSDKIGGIYYVDLYKAPAVDYFIYLDPDKLKDEIVYSKLNGHSAKVLKPEIELPAILMHSVFPENTYTLELFYSICYCLAVFDKRQTDNFVNFSIKSNIAFPVRVCLCLTALLHYEAFGYIPDVLSKTLKAVGGGCPREVSAFRAKDMSTPYKFLPSTFWSAFFRKLKEAPSLKSLGVQGVHMLNPVFLKDFSVSLYRKLTKQTYNQV